MRHVYLRSQPIPQADSAKYLGMNLDARMLWKRSIKQTVRELYWLIGGRSELDLECKLLFYNQIIKPIWTYELSLWRCAVKSNRDLVQKRQNIILRAIVDAYRFPQNKDIHKDLMKFVDDVIQKFAAAHEQRLLKHVNIEALQVLDTAKRYQASQTLRTSSSKRKLLN